MAAPQDIFSLEGKGLKLDTAADVEPYIAPLVANHDVREVRLLGNSLGKEACKRLGEVLATKKKLEVANFADIFTGRLLDEIPEAISSLLSSVLNLPKLRTINLNDNAFGLNTQAPLVAFLAAHVPLQHLHLNNNGLGPHAGILVAKALSDLHARKEEARAAGDKDVPDLETVVCGRNRLENGSMLAWASAFDKHNRVREVKMVQNGIRPEGIAHLLSSGLGKAAALRVLDLQDNTFTLPGARALADATAGWPALEELGISDSLLKGRGAVLVSDSLARGNNKKLETLRMQFNDMTSEGLVKLASAAEQALPALKWVEINGNKFSEDNETLLALQELLEGRDGGLDDLEDLEGEDSDEGDDDEDDAELEEEECVQRLSEAAKDATRRPVIPPADKAVDELTKELEKATIN